MTVSEFIQLIANIAILQEVQTLQDQRRVLERNAKTPAVWLVER